MSGNVTSGVCESVCAFRTPFMSEKTIRTAGLTSDIDTAVECFIHVMNLY